MKKLFVGVTVVIAIQILSSCDSELPSTYSDYSFPRIQLQKGIVNKYYSAVIYDSKTNEGNVIYSTNRLIENDTLLSYQYNAAKEITRKSKSIIRPEGILLLERTNYGTIDSLAYTIESEFTRWEEGRVSQKKLRYNYDEDEVTNTIRDSIGSEVLHLGVPAREVFYNIDREVYRDGAFWHSTKRKEKYLYAKGLGLFYYEYQGNGYTSKMELIEQMSISDFQTIEIPYPERIGYTDPNKSWSSEDFEICNKRINDYYNWQTPELEGGKKELSDFVLERYDGDKYPNQSGYLSIHFIINCRGETGRFIDQSHSLDYHKSTFSNEIKEHMMSILQEKKGWIPQLNTNTNELADVYHYVTFRIENGEIIEILP